MSVGFQTILVPVDFSVSTEVAIKKAIELSGKGTVIHLLNVQMDLLRGMGQKYSMTGNVETNHDIINTKVQKLKRGIEDSTTDIRVCTWISYDGSVHAGIEKKAQSLKPDLIIIGKNSHHSWLPFLNTVVPTKLAEHTGIPVLTVKPGAIHNTIRKIIVPITSEETGHKRQVIRALCNSYKVQVYLVTFMAENTPNDFHASALLKFYQWMKTSINCPVEYVVLHGHNKAREILNYAEKINGDVLLVHPDVETRIGWPNRQISDMVPPGSKVQVLALQAHD